MKKIIKNTVASLLIVATFVLGAFVVGAPEVSAACDLSQGLSGGVECANPGNDVPQTLFDPNGGGIFNVIINVLLFVIGAISVVMLIIGGVRYTLSAGNSDAVGAAKNTIMYAIIGLVIAFLAYAIVNWVLGALMP